MKNCDCFTQKWGWWWKLTADIFWGQIKCGFHCPFCILWIGFMCSRLLLPASVPPSPLWDLDAGIDRPWSELESIFLGDLKWISVFCWLTVGAWARFLNLKGSPVNSLLGSAEFGRLWKILEKLVLQLRVAGNWLRGLLPSPGVCLSAAWFFSNPVSLANSEWWVDSSKGVSQRLFLTWLHSSWIVRVSLGQPGGCGSGVS